MGFWHLTSARNEGCLAEEKAEASPSQDASDIAWNGHFPLRRGGTIVFSLSSRGGFNISIQACKGGVSPGRQSERESLRLRIDAQTAELIWQGSDRQEGELLARHTDKNAGYREGRPEILWISLDPDNGVLKCGKGSRISGNVRIQFDLAREGKFLTPLKRETLSSFLSWPNKAVQLMNYNGPPVIESTIFDSPMVASRAEKVSSVYFEELVVLTDPSPRLLEDHQMHLSDFSQEDFTFPLQLPPDLQGLSQRILQPWLSLESIADSSGFTLADAMCHSLETPGLMLHKKLQEKIRGMPAGREKHSAQLTIALAPCQSASPGPPITLEILPRGHSSPPHDNARANGVLRLLHGNMDVSLFDEDLSKADEIAPLDEVELERGDALWFSPTRYQTHAMRNVGSTFCCYLMARQYASEDEVRWPFVRYKEVDGSVSSCRVSADLSFKEMQGAVMAELASALQQNSHLLEMESDLSRTASLRTQSWVDRTDSAMDYTASFRDEKAEPDAQPKAHRFGCTLLRRNLTKPARHGRFLLASPGILEDGSDITTVWP